MVRRLAPGVLAVPLLLATMGGCPAANQANPTKISDGATTISAKMTGTWNAPGGEFCRWWIVNKNGVVVDNGNTVVTRSGRRDQRSGPRAEQSQTAIIGDNAIGGKLRSDGCGGWEK